MIPPVKHQSCDTEGCICNHALAQAGNPVCSLFPCIKLCEFNPLSSNFIPTYHDSIKKHREYGILK